MVKIWRARSGNESIAYATTDLDMLSWGADDLGALTYFLGAYAYMAAEQMTDELLEALGIEESQIDDKLGETDRCDRRQGHS